MKKYFTFCLMVICTLSMAQTNSLDYQGKTETEKVAEVRAQTGIFTYVKKTDGLISNTFYTEGTAKTSDGGTSSYIIAKNQEVANKEVLETSIEMNIYPNPVSGSTVVFNVDGIENLTIQNTELKIYDSLGRELKKSKIADQQTVIDIGTLQPGIYLYKLYNRNGLLGKGKFVVN